MLRFRALTTDKFAIVPHCVLCGKSHAFGTPCDQQRLDELRRSVEKMARDQASLGIYHTSSTTFVRIVTPYLQEEEPL